MKIAFASFVICALALSSAPLSADLIESFSGSGPHSAAGGPTGFDNSGWVVLGDPGSFQSNSFGEQVYQQNSTGSDFDSLIRIWGTRAFEAQLEISNPVILDSFSGVRFGAVDGGAGDFLMILQPRQGQMIVELRNNIGGNHTIAGELGLGDATLVDRVTMYLNYYPDLINGGGIFNAYVDVNESGMIQYVGGVDGTVYTTNAISNRNLVLTTFALDGQPASAQFDHLDVDAVPEPWSAFSIGLIGFLFLSMRSRQRSRGQYEVRSQPD